MPLLTHKRRRDYRKEGLQPTSLVARWVPRVFRERAIFIPVSIGLLALLLMVAAVEGWRTGFPYQVGQRLDHGVAARVSFKRLNLSATEKAKEEAGAKVRPIFVNDPTLLKDLRLRLEANMLSVASAKKLEDVEPEVRKAFGLAPSDAKQNGQKPKSKSSQDIQKDFNLLKANLSGEGGTSRETIKKLTAEFARFIEPLRKYGRARSSDLEKLQLQVGDPVMIVPKGNPKATPVEATRADIVLEDSLNKDSGRLGMRLMKEFPDLSSLNFRDFLNKWLLAQVSFTLEYDDERTKAAVQLARESAEPVYDSYEKNQTLLEAGQVINDEVLNLLRAEYVAYEGQIPWAQRAQRMLTVTVLLLLLAVLVGHYIVRNEPKMVRSPVRLALYLGALATAVALGRLLSTGGWRAEVIPLTVTVMIFAVAYNQRLGLMTGLALSLVITLSTTAELTQFVVLFAVACAAVIPLSQVPSRSALIKVGFWSAAVYFVVSWCADTVWNRALGSGLTDTQLLLTSLRGAGSCLVAGYLVAGSLPFIESAFGVVTDISLLEMSDVSHPLLQELARRAPGTYNHSISVATIGEAAADAIAANGLLVRVGAYFHDIGKMLKPEYFVENMAAGGESRHKNLAPAMSTLIIIGHVKDGVDLARQHNLPRSIIDFIEQHHGTTLVEFFYHAATKQAELQPDHRHDAQESSFRYPGPKPQSKEAGVMMLADAVESASRTLSDPTPKRIESLVKSISMKRLLDDQLDESSLTLSEIRVVEDSLIKSLIAVYHGRIKYPEQRSA
jgi:cyclic-di-AMP phosphodiesterase PgpH